MTDDKTKSAKPKAEPKSPPWWGLTPREFVTHLVAVALVSVTLLLIGRQLWDPGDDNVAHARDISSILGPWVGVVIGYYFGVSSGENQAKAATTQLDTEKTKLALQTGKVEEATTGSVSDAQKLEESRQLAEQFRAIAAELSRNAEQSKQEVTDLKQKLNEIQNPNA